MPAPNRRFRGRPFQPKEEHRLNERIRVPEVRLVDQHGNQVGVVPTRQALDMAKEAKLDLMEVAPNARPPVCKITDYGKFKYEKKKKEKQAKKNQVVILVKEVQIRPNTDVHDRDFKIKKCEQFLDEGDKVKISMLFRGREIVHKDRGFQLMREIFAAVNELSTQEQPPKMEGRKMIMILAPTKKKAASKAKSEPDSKDAPRKESAPKAKKDSEPAAEPTAGSTAKPTAEKAVDPQKSEAEVQA